ncbi:ATP-binding protein [Anaerovorax odorimutans]|uniref:ATP-binding protein n=1 Tax=Anaerovorax odorimutans TaxID=109327 RepID=A0ABT1RNK3_9FIRM|nr:ATP-binding protein [Anaerovorax odorimutans]MCQ4636764.1 ATP-binding protein [Anaerovorax odorimutans]
MGIYTDALILMIVLMVILSVFFVIAFRTHKKISEENKFLLERWAAQRQHLKGLESFSQEVRAMTKDVRRLTRFFEDGSPHSLRRQLDAEQSCLDSCNALLSKVRCGNPEVDALLFSKTVICEKYGIEFEVTICRIPEGKLTEIELTSLLGNLLDNAIEAAYASPAPRPFVKMNCQFRSGVFLIRIENSKDPARNPMANHMKTDKENPQFHGLGLRILDGIVKKYDGVMKMEDKGDTFTSSVSLILG